MQRARWVSKVIDCVREGPRSPIAIAPCRWRWFDLCKCWFQRVVSSYRVKRRESMKDGFKVIDADRHILEPTDLYQNYLPEKFKHRVRLAGPNQTVREVDGKPVSDSAQRPGRAME